MLFSVSDKKSINYFVSDLRIYFSQRQKELSYAQHVNNTFKDICFVLFVFLVRNIGGPGTMAYTLCQYYPNMKITVCDLQSVVDSARHFRPSLEDCPNQGNIFYAVGNFFQGDLAKAELYILSCILHDWSDEKADLILSNVYECLPQVRNDLLSFSSRVEN